MCIVFGLQCLFPAPRPDSPQDAPKKISGQSACADGQEQASEEDQADQVEARAGRVGPRRQVVLNKEESYDPDDHEEHDRNEGERPDGLRGAAAGWSGLGLPGVRAPAMA
jgi:hypothetical protein